MPHDKYLLAKLSSVIVIRTPKEECRREKGTVIIG